MGVSGQRHTPAVLLPPGKGLPVPIVPHCTGGWVGPRACLDTEVRWKISCLCRGSNLDRPVVQSVVRHYTDWATPAPLTLPLRWLNQEGWYGKKQMKKWEMQAKFWSENIEYNTSRDLGVDGRIIFKLTVDKQDKKFYTEFDWFMIGS
jgi:hypothetical protein